MLTRVLIDTDALRHNISMLSELIGARALLAPTVKGNAYGHGLVLASRAFVAAGADWLCVNAVYEASALREAGLEVPIYIMGYVGNDEVEEALACDARMVVYDPSLVERAARLAERMGKVARFHLKVETGNNRQGLLPPQATALAIAIDQSPHCVLEGIATHFANVEDTTDHSFARIQIQRFLAFSAHLKSIGIHVPLRHMANSAATILWPESHLDLVRSGIATYGMWPSTETLVSAMMTNRHRIDLEPALTWTCKVAQVKDLDAGEFVGYGCSFRTTHPTTLAVLPIGYYDGYDRQLSNIAYVLIDGQRAPVRGRVCMNMIMVDVTHIPAVHPEQEVVLLGASGQERISAEQLASWANSINYEITTRINERIPRVALEEGP